MPTEKRATFNEVAELYDKARQSYPAAMIEDLCRLAELESGARILEIGPGTGIFTRQLAERGYGIVGVELGADMVAVARRNLASFPRVAIEIGSFEEWPPPDEPFDLVVSATAFHWIDPAVRFTKTASLLRTGGYLAIASYLHVAGGDNLFFERIQTYYEKYMPGTPPNLRLPNSDELPAETADLIASDLYEQPVVSRYITEETYSTEQYLDLLSTYSSHLILEASARTQLLASIGDLLNKEFGGAIRKSYLNELIVARKR